MTDVARTQRVALIVDHPQRDLAGIVLVARELSRAGVVCHLVPLNLQEPEVWALRPDLVMLNFVRRGTEGFARRMREAGIQYGLIDTEGGVWGSPQEYADILWQDEELRQATSPACIWGPEMSRYLEEHRYFPPGRMRVTGCPRFDFYAPQWRSVLAEDEPRDATSAPRILINTNFSLTNGRFNSPVQNLDAATRHLGWSDDSIRGMVAAEKEAIAGIIELVASLARDYPRCRIVLRPHPFERVETYSARVGELENVEINTSGPVQAQIFKATAVIQRSCSTAVESGLAGVPTLSPLWIPAPMLMPIAEAVSQPCPAYADLRRALDGILENGNGASRTPRPSIPRAIEDWFHRADGCAYRRIADATLESLPPRRQVNEERCLRYLYGIGIRAESGGQAEMIFRRIRHALRLSPDWSFRALRSVPSTHWATSDKYFGVEMVRDLMVRIARADVGHSPNGVRIVAEYARERGDYSRAYFGRSVTLSPEV